MKMNLILTVMAAVTMAIVNGSAIASTLTPADDGAVPVYASLTDLLAVRKPGTDHGRPEYIPGYMGVGYGRPDHVPPVNPPIDTPAFVNGLIHPPYTVQFRASPGTFPADNFGRETVVPVPAAVWLFGSGLLGLIGMARRRKL